MCREAEEMRSVFFTSWPEYSKALWHWTKREREKEKETERGKHSSWQRERRRSVLPTQHSKTLTIKQYPVCDLCKHYLSHSVLALKVKSLLILDLERWDNLNTHLTLNCHPCRQYQSVICTLKPRFASSTEYFSCSSLNTSSFFSQTIQLCCTLFLF